MSNKRMLMAAGIASTLISCAAPSPPDAGGLAVPGGLAFSEFKGYEGWQVVSISHGKLLAVILGNPTMIAAYKSGAPANGKPIPDGAKMAKIHWNPKSNPSTPGQPAVPDTLHDVDFMVKDSKRFADGGGWGYAAFEYELATGMFRPGTIADMPPQGNDAKCGVKCHTQAQNRDYVFTEFPAR
jgi:hypothetical protein